MSISVALCTYNGEKYLPEQLASIARQTLLPDELVICDDGSTDATIAIVEAFKAQVSFPVRVHRNERNLGSTKNFEQALRLCRCQYIALADQDDVWLPEKLHRLLNLMAQPPYPGVVFSDANLIDAEGNLIGGSLWESVKFTSAEQERFRRGDVIQVLMKHPVVTGAAMMIRADLRDTVLPIPPQWTHDGWMVFLAALVSTVTLVEEKLMHYRKHGSNQIGVYERALGKQVQTARQLEQSYYLKIAEQYMLLLERIQELPAFAAKDSVTAGVAAKAAHYRARGTLPTNRLQRLSIVLQEFIKGSYTRYSSGHYSLLRDLLY